VFAYERVAGARRWQGYALRSLFIGMLFLGMAVTWWSMAAKWESRKAGSAKSFRYYAEIGQQYGYALVGIQLSLVLLAAPAATAGAICMDKARGNLALMLVTDLSNAEIVLGKLVARLAPVLGLVAGALPVISLGTLLGGLDPEAMGLAFLVTMDVAILGCALALALSVWAVKVHEALMATYLFWCIVALAYPTWVAFALGGTGVGAPPPWVLAINPYWLAYAPSTHPTAIGWADYALFTAGCVGTSVGLVLLSTLLLRRAVLRQVVRPTFGMKWRWVLPDLRAATRRRLPGPSLDGNPVLWREWHRNRPSRWGRLLWGTCAVGTTVLGLWGAIDALDQGVGPRPVMAIFAIGLIVFTGLLLLSASTATSLTEERVRGSLDALMATPLSTWAIVWGKWWGAFRAVPWLAFWPTVLMVAVVSAPYSSPGGWIPPSSVRHLGAGVKAYAVLHILGSVLAHGALLASLGLALATWFKKPGRAMALVVTAYLLIAAGWPILVVVMLDGAGMNQLLEGMAELSPVFATAGVLESVCFRRGEALYFHLAWGTWWLFLVSAAAAGLLAATWKTFDRCLGRMPEELDIAELLAACSGHRGFGSKASRPARAADSAGLTRW
jgi:ABC-type transport system involved in multi-copper enzyme maturation permease subunit